MTSFKRGDVVLVEFVFSEASGKKLRPALIISSPAYHKGRQEMIVAAITSNIQRKLFGDNVVSDWKGAGLLFPSMVTGILRTIKQTMVQRRIGAMPNPDLKAIDQTLRKCLSLP